MAKCVIDRVLPEGDSVLTILAYYQTEPQEVKYRRISELSKSIETKDKRRPP